MSDDIIKRIKDEDVEFVDLRFTDPRGKLQHVTFDASMIDEDMLEDGTMFDGSSIGGWKAINESDMTLMPDTSYTPIDPFFQNKTMFMFCDVLDPMSGESYNRDPRTTAKKAEAYLKASGAGDTIYVGPEAEFFVFDDVRWKTSQEATGYEVDSEEGPWNSGSMFEGGNMGHRPGHKGGYFPVPPIDSAQDMRSEMLAVMNELGLQPEKHHHEVAPAQHELGMRYSTLTTMADRMQVYKYIVQQVAHAYGKTATFMPKRAINAFANSSTNSYKRLVPGFEAPVLLAYSARNRSASIRIPFGAGPKAKRIETRFPDPAGNPYLTFSALLMAGLDGIENRIHPGDAMDKDLYDLPPEELKDIPTVCRSLREAMESLDADRAFLKKGNVMDDDQIDAYIDLKMEEVLRIETHPHPVEFELYYKC